MLGVVRGVPGDRAPISIRIVIQRGEFKSEVILTHFSATGFLASCSYFDISFKN